MAEHPITPPPKLVQQWLKERPVSEWAHNYLATQAARWGADQELEACCEWIGSMFNGHQTWADELRVDRRPKPPSLKEQALEALDLIPTHDNEGRTVGVDVSIIRRALEQLND